MTRPRTTERNAKAKARMAAAAEKVISRAAHLRESKARAMIYIARGEYVQAIASMQADLGRHPETAVHPARNSGIYQTSTISARKWVESIE